MEVVFLGVRGEKVVGGPTDANRFNKNSHGGNLLRGFMRIKIVTKRQRLTFPTLVRFSLRPNSHGR